jgi:hypothetical protein
MKSVAVFVKPFVGDGDAPVIAIESFEDFCD